MENLTYKETSGEREKKTPFFYQPKKILETDRKRLMKVDGTVLFPDAAPFIVSEVENNYEAILDLSMMELRENLQRGHLNALTVLCAYSWKAAIVNTSLECLDMFTLEAGQEARDLDDKYSGRPKPPLYGLPFALSGNIAVRGYKIHLGLVNRKANGLVEAADAPIVEFLKKQGAVLFCLTNVPMGLLSYVTTNPAHQTLNPWDYLRTPGGDAGGCGALVAAGGALFGVGTDLTGGLRIPAAFCGLTTLKPTQGRLYSTKCYGGVPGRGRLGLGHGFLTQTVEEQQFLLENIVGHPDYCKLCPETSGCPWNPRPQTVLEAEAAEAEKEKEEKRKQLEAKRSPNITFFTKSPLRHGPGTSQAGQEAREARENYRDEYLFNGAGPSEPTGARQSQQAAEAEAVPEVLGGAAEKVGAAHVAAAPAGPDVGPQRRMRIAYFYDDDDFRKVVPSSIAAVRETVDRLGRNHIVEEIKLMHGFTIRKLYVESTFDVAGMFFKNFFLDNGAYMREMCKDETVPGSLIPFIELLEGQTKRWWVRLSNFVRRIKSVPSLPFGAVKSLNTGVEDVRQNQETTDDFRHSWLEFMKQYDALICPAFITPAQKLEGPGKLLTGLFLTGLFNMLDVPAGVVPVGTVNEDDIKTLEKIERPAGHRYLRRRYATSIETLKLPIAVQVVTLPNQEEKCLEIMGYVESLMRNGVKRLKFNRQRHTNKKSGNSEEHFERVPG